MRGHVARKGSRYYAVVYEGFDAFTGKDKYRWHAAGDTRKAAEKLLGDLVKRLHDGDYRAPDRITFGDYLLERWLPTKRAQLRLSTFSSYKNNIELHVIPHLGAIPLQKLQPEDLDMFYAHLLTDGKRNGAGGGLAPKTVRIIHGILRKALADAMRKGTVSRNVADLADAPKVRLGGSREMTVWAADELRDFLASIEDSEWYVPIFLAANTGMRRGEVLGLTWRNVDLDTARLTVSQQFCRSSTKPRSPTSRHRTAAAPSISIRERSLCSGRGVVSSWSESSPPASARTRASCSPATTADQSTPTSSPSRGSD